MVNKRKLYTGTKKERSRKKRLLSICLMIVVFMMAFLLSGCDDTYDKAKEAYDGKKFGKAINIIEKSETKIADDEDLQSLYIDSIKRYIKSKSENNEYIEPIRIIESLKKTKEIKKEVGKDYSEYISSGFEYEIGEKAYGEAFRIITLMTKSNILSEDVVNDFIYTSAKSFQDNKEYALAALSYSKIEDYEDSKQLCKECWDKGAYRDTIALGTYNALGIKPNGTVVSAKNDELIKDHANRYPRLDSLKDMKMNVSKWKHVVSVCITDYNYAGLSEDGKVFYDVTGHKYMDDDNYEFDTSGLTDIVSIALESDIIVALDKYGNVHVAGNDEDGYEGLKKWTNIIDIDASYNSIVGVDAFGEAHLLFNDYSDGESGTEEEGSIEENEFSYKDIRQYIDEDSYSCYITEDGNLETDVTEESAAGVEFSNDSPVMDAEVMNPDDFKGIEAPDGNEFVQCDAMESVYVGLLSDGTVKVGGYMSGILANFGANKWKNIKEVHVGLIFNALVVGITSDGSIKLSGFDGGLYIPFHKKIESWGKLRKPTIVYRRIQ